MKIKTEQVVRLQPLGSASNLQDLGVHIMSLVTRWPERWSTEEYNV